MSRKDSHCSYCGHPFAEDAAWPRACPQCANVSYQNPLPVSVVLLPVGESVLAVKRAHHPGRGELALPGGFVEKPESWQEAGARELYEETGVRLAPADLSLFRAYSAPDGTILLFGLAPPVGPGDLPPFSPTAESSERVLLAEPVELAFSLHTRVVREYFAGPGAPTPPWLAWGRRLQALAQSGLAYTDNAFERERYREIRRIAAEIMGPPAGIEIEQLVNLFAKEQGYATPKVGVRAAVFREEAGEPAILLVREKRDGLWTLPGGWVDVGDSPSEAAIRETLEEAGVVVEPRRLVSVYDPQKHDDAPRRPFAVIRLFFLCQMVGGTPRPGLETEAVAFFPVGSLPPLSITVTVAQVQRMFDHYRDPRLPADYD